jgi:hypothetical protein
MTTSHFDRDIGRAIAADHHRIQMQYRPHAYKDGGEDDCSVCGMEQSDEIHKAVAVENSESEQAAKLSEAKP